MPPNHGPERPREPLYVEQPETLGVNLARLDRRDYLIRWQTLQQEAQDELDTYIDAYRMAHMGLGGGVLTVAGGIYGSYAAPARMGNIGAHRGHWWYRG